MRPRFRRPALLLLMALSVAAGSAHAADALRVMSFNVRTPADTDPGKRWEDRRDAMVTLIRAQRPEVIGTQELVRKQSDYLAAHLPDYRVFGKGRSGKDGTQGDEYMGVLYDSTRLKVLESGDFWLSDTPDVPGSITWGNLMPRMVTWALFQRQADGQRFYLYNTHLPYRDEDEPRRVLGAELILKRLAALPKDIPVVVTGDFNSEPGGTTYQAFTRGLKDARTLAAQVEGPRLTFHNFTGTPTTELDWILVRGFSVDHFSTLDDRPGGVLPSDHFPVQADLQFTAPAQRTAR